MDKLYSEFVTELKSSNPGKWHQMAKKIGMDHQSSNGDVMVMVESLSDLTNYQAAQKIAEHFGRISNEYEPVDNTQLPF